MKKIFIIILFLSLVYSPSNAQITEHPCVSDVVFYPADSFMFRQDRFNARNTITAHNEIVNSTIIYNSGYEITLGNGFTVGNDSYFETELTGCNQFGSIQNQKIHFTVSPNPVNSVSYITYQLPKEQEVHVYINDLYGLTARELLAPKKQPAGNYKIPIYNKQFLSGIYLITLVVDDEKIVEKMIVK